MHHYHNTGWFEVVIYVHFILILLNFILYLLQIIISQCELHGLLKPQDASMGLQGQNYFHKTKILDICINGAKIMMNKGLSMNQTEAQNSVS